MVINGSVSATGAAGILHSTGAPYGSNAMAANGAPAALIPALSALQDGNAATTRMPGEGESHGPAHLFAFGQIMGSLRQFDSNEVQDISRATLNGYDVLDGPRNNAAFGARCGLDQGQQGPAKLVL